MTENLFNDLGNEQEVQNAFAEMFSSPDPALFLTERFVEVNNRIEALKEAMLPLKKALAEAQSNMDWLESAARALYEATGASKMTRGNVMLTIKDSTATFVYDETEVPDTYLKKQPDILDIQKIRQALLKGIEIPGAKLSETPAVKFIILNTDEEDG
jgi:hypothetical protein